MPNPPTPDSTASEHLHPLIAAQRWEAWRRLMNNHGNAFAVGGAGYSDNRGVVVLGWDFLSRPLGRAEVSNLVAWLVMVSGVTAADLEPIFQAQGLRVGVMPDLAR